MVAGALALEIELHVVESVSQFLEGRVRIEVLIARGKQFADFLEAPPAGLLTLLGTVEGLANHLHQIVQLLIGRILADQHGYLVVVQPESLIIIK